MTHLQSRNSLLREYGGSAIDLFGAVAIKCKFCTVAKNHFFYVVGNALPPLSDLNTCFFMGFLKILCLVKPEIPLKCNFLHRD